MRTLLFIISIAFGMFKGFTQTKENSKIKQDSIVYKTGYGLRLGIDISKPILSIIDKNYSGFEIVGDYRVSKRWYLAAEVGYEDETTLEDYTTSTSKGSYARIGGNFNAYKNWLDMNNEIYVGSRYGVAIFEQTLNNYTPNVNNVYFPSQTVTVNKTETGLTAHWLEFHFGLKAETFKNLFVGFSFSYKIALSIDEQTNFKTLYAPGFNQINSSNTGFGFNYTISYVIPFVNK